MVTKYDYEQIDKFLYIVDLDLTDIVKKYLKRLILSSYAENFYEFSESLNIIHNSIQKTRSILKASEEESNVINKRDLKEEQFTEDKRFTEDEWFTKTNVEYGLEEHGLTGYELQRKLNIFYRTRDLFLKKYNKAAISIARGFAKRFFDAMDVILDSLASVLPPLGAVKEFKNSIEVVI